MLLGVVALLLLGATATILLVRRARAVEVGPPLALCPGPDAYGYRCDAGASYEYVDASTDTLLYSDDGFFTLDLPFAFTFYGAAYSAVNISTNGNLQLTTENTAYSNVCLTEAPAPEMGDMIAPYWNDLDLTFVGYIEYDIIGQSPERIVVIEWDDAPRYGAPDDTVSFEVQLFESSNDIVFLYEDAQTFEDNSGSGATIGLQSESQGFALQFGCDQPVVANGAVVYFPHPGGDEDEAMVRPAPILANSEPTSAPYPAKGDVAEIVARFERQGQTALPALRRQWLGQSPVRRSQWLWADMTGDGRDDLVVLWHGEDDQPELARLAVLDAPPGGPLAPIFDTRLSTRQESFGWMELVELAELTGDGAADALVQDPRDGRLLVASADGGQWQIYTVPEKCAGSMAVIEGAAGQSQIVRDGCAQPGRIVSAWNGAGFVTR
jgi:hypothetical protein